MIRPLFKLWLIFFGVLVSPSLGYSTHIQPITFDVEALLASVDGTVGKSADGPFFG